MEAETCRADEDSICRTEEAHNRQAAGAVNNSVQITDEVTDTETKGVVEDIKTRTSNSNNSVKFQVLNPTLQNRTTTTITTVGRTVTTYLVGITPAPVIILSSSMYGQQPNSTPVTDPPKVNTKFVTTMRTTTNTDKKGRVIKIV
jgi:hypothetical protein